MGLEVWGVKKRRMAVDLCKGRSCFEVSLREAFTTNEEMDILVPVLGWDGHIKGVFFFLFSAF